MARVSPHTECFYSSREASIQLTNMPKQFPEVGATKDLNSVAQNLTSEEASFRINSRKQIGNEGIARITLRSNNLQQMSSPITARDDRPVDSTPRGPRSYPRNCAYPNNRNFKLAE